MKSLAQQRSLHTITSPAILVLGIATGFFLRLYQLGNDSLWNDEVITMQAALQPTIQETLEYVRSLNFSMPLDYLVTWLIAKFSLSEFVLRFPSVLWGTASLLTCYLLFKRLSSKQVSLLGVWLLALSPLHIQYSQELRFYASLIFFYCLTTYLLLCAFDHPALRNWVLVWLVASIGALFHLYVLLSFVNGLACLALMRGSDRSKAVKGLMACGLTTALTIMPIYWYMEAGQAYNYPLFTTNETLWGVIGNGLGLRSITYTTDMTLGKVFTFCTLILFCIGSLRAVIHKNPLTAILIAMVLQIILLVLTALIVNHPITYRYLLFLHPLALLISAEGGVTLSNFINRWSYTLPLPGGMTPHSEGHHQNQWGYRLMMGMLLLSAIPAQLDYYRWPKSNARSVSEMILQMWKSGDKILVTPGYQARVYDYYLHDFYKSDKIAMAVNPTEIEGLPSDSTTHLTFLVYAISFANQSVRERNDLGYITGLGYKPILFSENEYGFHSLFVRR